MREGILASGCTLSRRILREERPPPLDADAGVFGGIQALHQEPPRNQEARPERDQFRLPDASAVLDRNFLQAGPHLARGGEQVRFKIEPRRSEAEAAEGLLRETPQPPAEGAHGHAKKESRRADPETRSTKTEGC